jgi:FkbM family methyltransferase
MEGVMALSDVLRFVMRHPLNRRKPLRALLEFISWQLGSRLVPGVVIVDWIEGARLVVRTGQTGLTGNIYCGLQEFAEMGYLLHVLRPGELFVDVGANLGSYTVLAATVVGADVVCVEPVPETFAQLVENVRINQSESRVTCVNAGVGVSEGTLRLSTGLGPGNRIVEDDDGAGSVEVPATTLDRMLSERHPVLMKIDVEGFETAVIEGASGTLAIPTLHSVIMELNGSGRTYGFDEERLLETMRGHGFSAYAYDPLTRVLRPLDTADPRLENCIFIRDLVHATSRVQGARRYDIRGCQL